ncbi:LysR family transcriptional regulator [Amycolatopsis thermophila]|uniref:DNA-binding transcriptional LysR family regulator n=1 Tax=Amycolatopsis thermophila TaxID=206084 RepID=A0ABU0F2H8_9PSEU|nr:LysR family transcriptional regulator [Amycolatopsis thermophila]MDQ0381703.1 DNA-binding transcriptional LysR family regulator [Amycolatopsis thermophila]
MELRQLEYFVMVAEEGNFTRAAERVHVAQPGVSAQIRRLERELGHELLDRSGRAVRPTEVGEAVLPYARAALAAVAGARLVADEFRGLVRGRVALGMVTSHNFDVPGLLADFHDEYPGVEITLVEDRSEQLTDGIRTGRLDAAIVSMATDERPSGLDVAVLTDQAIFAAVGRDDAWAARADVPLEELRSRPLISLPAGTGLRARLDEAFAAKGLTARIGFEAAHPTVLADLAARGLGVAILPESVATARPDLHPLPITDPPLRGCLALAWRAAGPVSPAARVFLDRARAALG